MPKTLPDKKIIQGQVAIKCESPNPDYSGCIYVPRELTPEQFHIWWIGTNENRPEISAQQAMYQDRQHLILEWHIDGIRPDHVTPEGDKFPSVWFWQFIAVATELQLEATQSYPKLQSNWTNAINGMTEPMESQ